MREALDAGVDLVECDVHAYRGVLEVRHHKLLGPTHLWDKWELVRRRDFALIELDELMTALGDDPRLMVDLKGVHRGLAPAVSKVLSAHSPDSAVTVCSKHWWMLDSFASPVRRVLSASNRRAMTRLLRELDREPAYGVSVRRSLLDPDLVTRLRARTELVMTWPVDTLAELDDARRVGVDAVIGKDLPLLTKVLAMPR